MKSSRAWQALAERRETWLTMLPDARGDLLPWLLALDWKTFSELTAFCVAIHVDGVREAERQHAPMDALAGSLGVDMPTIGRPPPRATSDGSPRHRWSQQ